MCSAPFTDWSARGLSDPEIVDQLKLTEVTVHSCIAWLTHFLHFDNRAELVLYASAVRPVRWGLRAI